jgi:hypothetical protein
LCGERRDDEFKIEDEMTITGLPYSLVRKNCARGLGADQGRARV